MTVPALELTRLTIAHGTVELVRSVSLTLPRGRTIALVGESGSGKSLIGRAALGLLGGRTGGPDIRSGRVAVAGLDLATIGERGRRALRGDIAGLVVQEPASSLDPCFSVGWQLDEAIRLHRGRSSRRELAHRLEAVGIARPARRLADAPHLFSGGQLQRVAIAIATANGPALLVADEPTTALDATTRAQTLDLIDDARRARDMGVLLITHDLGVVAERADGIAVLYSGALVEHGPTADILARPRHPYTAALLDCRIDPTRRSAPLTSIDGQMPAPDLRPSGCAFRTRCRHAVAVCEDEPPFEDGVACWRADVWDRTARASRIGAPPASVTPGRAGADTVPPHAPVLQLDDVSKSYGPGADALIGISLALARGEVLGVVGESGSGKSTLGRVALGLLPPTGGRVLVEGEALSTLGPAALRRKRRRMQMIFQNPRASLDPRLSIGEQIADPLRIHGLGDRQARAARVRALFDLVGLPFLSAERLPYRFSGGQLQRVAIARALATDPVLVVADEPVASLDLSIQAQILDLLLELRTRLGLGLLFISHDLAVVGHVATAIAVMQDGRIVEHGPAERILTAPRHPASQALLAAARLS